MRYTKKSTTVEAIQIAHCEMTLTWPRLSVEDDDGYQTGRHGDWLVKHENGTLEIMTDTRFRKEFHLEVPAPTWQPLPWVPDYRKPVESDRQMWRPLYDEGPRCAPYSHIPDGTIIGIAQQEPRMR